MADLAPGPVRRAADAVIQALGAPQLSQDLLRRAVVRYGAVARDVALDPTEMLASLAPVVRRGIAQLAPGEQAAVQSWVQWWAIHGYHRARLSARRAAARGPDAYPTRRLAASGATKGSSVIGRPGTAYCRRAGTATSLRSGQRSAVSAPPNTQPVSMSTVSCFHRGASTGVWPYTTSASPS